MKQKVLVECALPKDYCLGNIFYTTDLDELRMGDFYSISDDKKISKKTLAEDGFSFDTIPFTKWGEAVISQLFRTDQGMWKSTFRIIFDDGVVKDIYEVSPVLIDDSKDD